MLIDDVLNKNCDVVKFLFAKKLNNTIILVGKKIKKKFDLYELPLKSSILNIYKALEEFDEPLVDSYVYDISRKIFVIRQEDYICIFPMHENKM